MRPAHSRVSGIEVEDGPHARRGKLLFETGNKCDLLPVIFVLFCWLIWHRMMRYGFVLQNGQRRYPSVLPNTKEDCLQVIERGCH